MQLAHAAHRMRLVLDEFVKIEHEMAVVPLGVLAAMRTAALLGTTSRRVAFEAKSGIGYFIALALGRELRTATYIHVGLVVAVVLGQQGVPLVERHRHAYLRQCLHIEDEVPLVAPLLAGQRLDRLSGQLGIIRIVGLVGRRYRLFGRLGKDQRPILAATDRQYRRRQYREDISE